MKPPRSFHDFTREFHQDLDLVYPDWASEAPHDRHKIYESFRLSYGDPSVTELAAYFRRLLDDTDADLGTLWFDESKADWVISDAGLRRLFEDFEVWASSR